MSEITREQRPEWIWPRADSHVVLSAAGSIEVLKTFVEPGGGFSPGVRTFGVTVWVWLSGEHRLVAPELLPREAIRDRLLGGFLPIHRSRWRAGPLEMDLRLGVEPCPDHHQVLDTLWCRALNRGEQPVRATVLLVVRGLGPAGGPVYSLTYDHEHLGFLVNDAVAVIGTRHPARNGCVSLATHQVDVSVPLRRGEIPTAVSAADRDGWCGGVLAYETEIEPGGEWDTWWDFPVLPARLGPPPAVVERRRLPARDRLDRLADQWRETLTPLAIELPDARYQEAFHASLMHLVAAMVGPEPRIATICYPLLWCRDGAYIVNALDKAGLSRFSRPAVDRLSEDVWAGGFGPEADAPGEALWAIGEHYRLTGDLAWLERIFPKVTERAEWLIRMRHTSEPVRLPARNVLPRTRLHRDQELVCEAAADGLIVGRMDWHRPLFWVNAFAAAGLRLAAEMASALGRPESAAWRAEGDELAAALRARIDGFGRNERDSVCAIWPTEVLDRGDAEAARAFDSWWSQHRHDRQGGYRGEPRWRYFELGQAHNLLLLGMRDRALLTVEQFLRTQDAPGLYAWAEGDHTGDPTGDWRMIRGWWPTSKIMPHGWVAAEMALLIRDLLVHEAGDRLVIGAGVRPEWLSSCEPLAVSGAPTRFGTVDWRFETIGTGRHTLTIRCRPTTPPGGYLVRLPLPPSASVELDGAGLREVDGDWPVRSDRDEVTLTIATL